MSSDVFRAHGGVVGISCRRQGAFDNVIVGSSCSLEPHGGMMGQLVASGPWWHEDTFITVIFYSRVGFSAGQRLAKYGIRIPRMQRLEN